MFKILIVEDDKELSQLFQKVLEKNGYQGIKGANGHEATIRLFPDAQAQCKGSHHLWL